MTNILSENNNRCTVNEFILACSFILFIFVKNHLLVTSDVIICTGCTIFVNTLYVYWGKKSIEQKLSFSNAAHLLDLIYQKSSSYLKQYESYGLHKISASGEIST